MAAVVPFMPLIEKGLSQLIDRIWPDKAAQAAERAAAQAHADEVAAQVAQSYLDAAKASDQQQIDLDKLEESAGGPTWLQFYKSGWRPAIGWVGAAALGCYYVPYCLVATVIWAHQCWVTHMLAARPDLGITDLLGLLGSLLGLSAMRSMDKRAGLG